MRKFRFLPLLVAATFVVGACGDDNGTTGTTGDVLSAAEVDEVFEALSAVGGGLLPVFSQAGGPMASPIPISETIDESASCPEGGSTGISGDIDGTVDDVTFESDLNFDLDQSYNNCAVQTESMKIFTIDGTIGITGNLSISQTSASGKLTWSGSFDWSSDDGRSGGCGYQVELSFSSSSASYSGTVCGESVSANASF